jgi:hypothetical protein
MVCSNGTVPVSVLVAKACSVPAQQRASPWRANHHSRVDDLDANPKKKRRPTSRTRWWLWEPYT